MNPMDAPILKTPIAAFGAGMLMLGGCTAVAPVGSAKNPLPQSPTATDRVHWPAQYEPEQALFFVHNQIDIAAPPEVVWGVLIEAETWPDWYEGATGVVVNGAKDGRLYQNASFRWQTMGLRFTSVVKEFEAPTRLSWESRKQAIQGYHAWLLIPIENGTRLVTDESQHGFFGVDAKPLPEKQAAPSTRHLVSRDQSAC